MCDGICEGVCEGMSCDCIEVMAAGGTCVATSEEVDEEWFPRAVAVYFIANVILNLTDVVLEGQSIGVCRTATSAEIPGVPVYNFSSNSTSMGSPSVVPVQGGYGMDLWLAAYILSAVVLIPLQLWLIPHITFGEKFWQKFKPWKGGDKKNPHCFLYAVGDSGSEEYLECMTINIMVFSVFEDIVHILISAGRTYFINQSIGNKIVFLETAGQTAAVLLLIAESFRFFMRWLYVYNRVFLQCSCWCCDNHLQFLQALFKYATFFTSATSFFFSLAGPMFSTFTNLELTPATFGGSYFGWLGSISIASFILYWKCHRKRK